MCRKLPTDSCDCETRSRSCKICRPGNALTHKMLSDQTTKMADSERVGPLATTVVSSLVTAIDFSRRINPMGNVSKCEYSMARGGYSEMVSTVCAFSRSFTYIQSKSLQYISAPTLRGSIEFIYHAYFYDGMKSPYFDAGSISMPFMQAASRRCLCVREQTCLHLMSLTASDIRL